jgi:multiple antibiotic resistance protein
MSDSLATESIRFLVALVAIVDPIAVVPFFLDLTRGQTTAERRRIARTTGLAVGIVLVVAALSGEAILQLVGTSLAAFRVGGGIVILLMAISMLMAQTTPIRQTAEEARAAEDLAGVAVVPIAIPLLAGPGAISAVVIQMDRGDGPLHAALVLASIAVVAASCWLTLRHAEQVGRAVGPIGLNVIVRLFGLVLAAIAVETIANGLRLLFPPLAG